MTRPLTGPAAGLAARLPGRARLHEMFPGFAVSVLVAATALEMLRAGPATEHALRRDGLYYKTPFL